MAKDFTGLKKDDHERLTEAVTMYRNFTGKDLSGVVSGIPVANPEEDEKAKQAAEQEALDKRAKVDRELEKAAQRARQLKIEAEGGRQPGNPGPGQPALATERAKAEGRGRSSKDEDK